MTDSLAPSGIDLPSPTLSARLAELAGYLAAPAAGRLTEEQRALALGVARRLVQRIAIELDPGLDRDTLWQDWVNGGIPAAPRLAAPCFARAEEHRWRMQTMPYVAARPSEEADAADADATKPQDAVPPTPVEGAYLALRIADGRRRDALGNPCIAPADLDPELLHTLLLDIAAWQLARTDGGRDRGTRLGDAVNALQAKLADARGVDAAAVAYHAALSAENAVTAAAEAAISGHDWPAVIALAAAAHGQRYDAMALALLTAQAAALPSLLAPLRLERTAIAPLEASLARLAARALSDDVAADLAPPPENGR